MKSSDNVRVIVDKEGNTTGVLLPVSYFQNLINELEDLKDVQLAYERKNKRSKIIPYEDLKKELFGNE